MSAVVWVIAVVVAALGSYCWGYLNGLAKASPELLAAAWAGARYSNALRAIQEAGVRGQMVPGTDELERLFWDWNDRTRAALAKAGR